MKPWIVMVTLAFAVIFARWFLWAYPEASQATAHIGWLLPNMTFG